MYFGGILGSELGEILILDDSSKILQVYFISNGNTPNNLQESPLTKECKKQLQEYFKQKRKVFNLPLNPLGSTFQKSVWESLCKIPYGEVRSYQDIAKSIGNIKASRAVGNANNRNPISIIIPCHRVIGKNNQLVGYAGGLEIKQKLLKLEGITL